MRTQRPAAEDDTENPYTYVDDEEASPRRSTRARHTADTQGTNGHAADVAGTSEEPEPETTSLMEVVATTISDERLARFKTHLQQRFREARAPSIPLLQIKEQLNKAFEHEPYADGEIKAALHKMEEDNQIMIADDIVFLI